jgi:cytochrome c oxidase assembly protein Cox11
MNPKAKFFTRLFAFFILSFIALQIYNRFCLFGNNCQPIYFSKYLPRTEGSQELEIDFKVQNYRADLDFVSLKPDLKTVTNRLNSVTFVAKNTTNKPIQFRPKIIVSPEEFTDHIERISCLCSQTYYLEPKEKVKLTMEFFIKPSIAKVRNLADDNTLRITYKTD